MNVPQILYAVRWLVWDTFRQSLASGVFWLLLTFSGIAILICLSVGVEGGTDPLPHQPGEKREILNPNDPLARDPKKPRDSVVVAGGTLTIGFGSFRIPFPGFREDTIRHIQLLLAWAVADNLGVWLALIFTAGFLPTFLDPAAASVILTKPVPRWALLVGKYLGVLVLVFVQATVFVVGTWMALGIKTGVLDAAYLLCIPLLLLHFSVFFSMSVLVAVATRSTVASVFGSMLFWLMCWGMNYGRNLVVTVPDLGLSDTLYALTQVVYWILPKPLDFGLILFDAMKAGDFFGRPLDAAAMATQGAYFPELAVLSSLLFGAAILAAAGWELGHADY